jgi:hypothetical protein
MLDEQEFARARAELRGNKISNNSNNIKKNEVFAESSPASPSKMEKNNDSVVPVVVKLNLPPKIKFSPQKKEGNSFDNNYNKNNNNDDDLNDELDRYNNNNLKEMPTNNNDLNNLNSSDSVGSINFDSSKLLLSYLIILYLIF